MARVSTGRVPPTARWRLRTCLGARVFVEAWKGYAPQKNSAIEKATGDWILSLDADEELDPNAIRVIPRSPPSGELSCSPVRLGITPEP